MKLLIAGGAGQLGREFPNFHNNRDVEIITFSHEQLDITDIVKVAAAIEHHRPTFVVNCAAFTNVDKSETETEKAFAINRDGVKVLAEVCAQQKIPLIHISTDYVFDGKHQEPYVETDAVNPINQYGLSKLEGENVLREIHPQHIILRVSSVFGAHGNNFAKTIFKRAHEQPTLRVIADKIACPTPARSIAQTVMQVANQILQGNTAWGTYHYCGTPPVNWYQFAQVIVQVAQQINPTAQLAIVSPTDSSEFPTPAKRPVFSVLNCQKIQEQFSIPVCDWQPELERMLSILAQELMV